MSDSPAFQPRKKTALDVDSLRLFSEPVDGSKGRAATCVTYFINNCPRIDVYTNVESDQSNNKGLIRAKINARILYQMFAILNRLIATPGERKYFIDIKNCPWIQSEKRRSKDPVTTERIILGRDAEGEIFMSVLSAKGNRPKIKFVFKDEEDIPDFYKKDSFGVIGIAGGEISKSEKSEIAAAAYMESIRDLYSTVAALEYVPPVPKDNNGGGGKQGGGYGGGGGGYGGGKPSYDADEDLPFD